MAKRPAHHVLDIYDVNLWLATDLGQWRQLMTRFEGELTEENAASLGSTSLILDTEGQGAVHLCVWLDVEAHGQNANGFVQSAAHEAVHVASMMLGHFGHKLRAKDEPHAYLAGWVTAWLIEQTEWVPGR